MKRTALALGALALVITPGLSLAEELSDAAMRTKLQMAATLDVDPETYTLDELVQLKCIMESGDSEHDKDRKIQAIKGFGRSTDDVTTAEKAQLAASLGVNPEVYSLTELSMLKSMHEDDQCQITNPAEFVKHGESLTEPAASVKSQLALSLGVSATDYTLTELVKMKAKRAADE